VEPEGTLNTPLLALKMRVYQLNPILCQFWQLQDNLVAVSKSNPQQTTVLQGRDVIE